MDAGQPPAARQQAWNQGASPRRFTSAHLYSQMMCGLPLRSTSTGYPATTTRCCTFSAIPFRCFIANGVLLAAAIKRDSHICHCRRRQTVVRAPMSPGVSPGRSLSGSVQMQSSRCCSWLAPWWASSLSVSAGLSSLAAPSSKRRHARGESVGARAKLLTAGLQCCAAHRVCSSARCT